MAPGFRQFRGGYRFDRFAGAPGSEKVLFGIPDTVRLSLLGAAGRPTPVLVKTGARVRAGQMLAQGGAPPSSPVLAPVGGTVAFVERNGSALVITADRGADLEPLERRYAEWQNVSRDNLEDALYVSGVTGFPASGIPTRRGSSTVGPDDVEHILVEATRAELWAPRLETLVAGGLERLCSGMAILCKVLPNAALTMVVDRADGAVARAVRDAVGSSARVLTVASKYPLGHEAVLLPAVLGRSLARGQRAIDCGVLVIDVETVMQVHDVVVNGTPPVERVVALGGPGFAKPCHVAVRIGTPVGALLERFGAPGVESRLVVNGVLTGAAVTDRGMGTDARCRMLAAIPENREGEVLGFARPGFAKDSYSRTFAAALLGSAKRVDTNVHGEGRACLSCGYCEQVCPVGIMPQVLHRYVSRDVIDEAILRFRIMDCIDCNLCSYVCPSKIAVAELLRRGKVRLAEEGFADIPAAPAAPGAKGGDRV